MTTNQETLKHEFLKELHRTSGKRLEDSDDNERYRALGNLLKGLIGDMWSMQKENNKDKKQVYLLSMEYLTGTFTKKNLNYLRMYDQVESMMEDLGISLENVLKEEKDPALGNGGLGRILGAFLDSLATQEVPGHAYGLRYSKGLFRQVITDGKQTELADPWLAKKNIWQFKRENEFYEVRFGGYIDVAGRGSVLDFKHVNYESIKAVPYDIPILGYQSATVNTLRLWSAESFKDLSFYDFSVGDFDKSYRSVNHANAITAFLYPSDHNEASKILRLKQEYFLVSSSIQDIVHKYKMSGKPISEFSKFVAIQINDTHPVLAIPELMRLLMDEYELTWELAWEITQEVFAFTNHNTVWESMEEWDEQLFRNLLPRMWMIIEEINYRFIYLLHIEKELTHPDLWERYSIIDNNKVYMIRLAVVGSHSINGVSQVHTELLTQSILKDFYDVFPEKFNNKTNGVDHRKWLLKANPDLSILINELIGSRFICDSKDLKKLLAYENDELLKERIAKIKFDNKVKLSKHILEKYHIKLNPYSIFDVQIHRIHENRRQLLNIFYVMDLYDQLRKNPNLDVTPRTFIFAGKANPDYYIAKEVIRLIVRLSNVINHDISIKDKIKVIFYENFDEDAAEMIIPAADVSEQLSTARQEASGTGNIKAMMNGAISLSTLNGAHKEIREVLTQENMILFGIGTPEIANYKNQEPYSSKAIYHQDAVIKNIMDQLVEEADFSSIFDVLYKYNDAYFILRDYKDYKLAQEKIGHLYRNRNKWNEMSLINIAHSGDFSADVCVEQYCEEIWKLNKGIE